MGFASSSPTNEALDGDHVACNNAGVLQQLLCLLMELLAARDDRVRNGEEDNLDKLDADNLLVLASPGARKRT
jgi:hypothetical protein